MARVSAPTLLGALLLITLTHPTGAADHFFTFGGGYAPQGNQVSLEKNVLFFQRVLAEQGKADSTQHYLFADGNDPARDLHYTVGERPDLRLHYLLAGVFGEEEDIYHAYRSNEVPRLNGGSTPQAVDEYFNNIGCKLTGDDRLFIYYTGHGGRGEKDDPANTTLELWHDQEMPMKAFVERLDKVPAEVSVVIVMVQCFSGGFANVIFNGGDPARGLTAHDRAGFFATVHDRSAAGCTPDIEEANYQEYSTYFWAALHGKTRLGKAIARPDYDGDGATSFDEAHAFALLESDSIDLSTKTSDVLLRQYSTIDPAKRPANVTDPLLTPDTAYAALLSAAGPCERAVMEGLSGELGLADSQRAAAAAAAAEQVERRRGGLGRERKRLMKEYNTVRKSIARSLKARWPELGNPWHPAVVNILHDEADEVLAAIQGHDKFPRYRELVGRINTIDIDRLDLERRWAKHQRLIRTLENVALAANLPQVAPPEVCSRYAKLIAAEHGTLR